MQKFQNAGGDQDTGCNLKWAQPPEKQRQNQAPEHFVKDTTQRIIDPIVQIATVKLAVETDWRDQDNG